MNRRVLCICLDAFDDALSESLISSGRLPGLARIKADSARFKLEHGRDGRARYTGLTWEHFSSGRTPASSDKWSVISFDPRSFRVTQSFATERPFLAGTDARCVVFDAPYFDLKTLPNGLGAVGWGGHDPGVRRFSRPANLFADIERRFGPAPDPLLLNTMVYPSVERTEQLGAMLCASVKRRTDIAEWLLTEYSPDWDVAVLGMGESHDAVELLYHGLDPNHHLAQIPSAAPARAAFISVYEAISDQLERLSKRFPDVTLVAFTMHGMGDNDTDLPTMLLLPELLYRMQFDRPLFEPRSDWRAGPVPMLAPGENWNDVLREAMNHTEQQRIDSAQMLRWARQTAGTAARGLLGRKLAQTLANGLSSGRDSFLDVEWMPASQYARYWAEMDAFALPAYFDGRVRVNLQGREKNGRVPLSRYRATLDRIDEALRNCVDLKTGQPVVREIARATGDDPTQMPNSRADISVLWNGSPIGFRHPVYGDIGPAPLRRMGGHSGGYGALYVKGAGIAAGNYGLRSSFDVAPTVMALSGMPCHATLDGEAVLGLRNPVPSPDARMARGSGGPLRFAGGDS